MSRIVRLSISLEEDLLEEFDRFCRDERFATRSEAVRQLIRETLTRRAWMDDAGDVAGTLTLVFDHHRAKLRDQLLELQHDAGDLIVSTMHTHLTHSLCMEVIVLRGPAVRVREVAAQLKGLKGIFRGELVIARAEDVPDESTD
ncbi:nickel-responsive transcriptional regulator NikR [Thermostilla marina]